MPGRLFENSTPLFGPYRLEIMVPDQIPAVTSIMMASEPWESYGFTSHTIEKFIGGCVEAKIARVILCSEKEKEETPENIAMEYVVGIAVVQPGFLGGRFLEILAVAEQHRQKGIGKKVIETICRECPSNIRDLFVLAAMSNTDAIAFYDKMDFVDVGELPGLILPNKVERLIWRRFRE